MDQSISQKDTAILRALAAEVAEIAARPVQKERARLWRLHNDLKASQPLLFISPENGWSELIPQGELTAEGELARSWEMRLRQIIYNERFLKDDQVVDGVFAVPVVSSRDGWGLPIVHVGGENRGAYRVKPALEDYERDFPKLHFPKISVDYEASDRLLAEARRVFDGLLTVRRKTFWWWTMGMTWSYIDLRGLEEFMCDMLLEPAWVHRMMEFFCQGQLDMLDDLTARGLLSLNTGNDYVGSGGFGFTDELPACGSLGRNVTPRDMWGFVESQETVSISPEMYGEFVFPYHMRMAERFGLNCYGCCEPYDARWKYAKQLPRLRRISCSPWSTWENIPENFGANYIASIKPNPALISRPEMNEEPARAEIRRALTSTVGCVPELVMKDNHTFGGNRRNPARWVEIAREEIDRVSGL